MKKLLCALLLCVLLCLCACARTQTVTQEIFAMDTVISVTIYNNEDKIGAKRQKGENYARKRKCTRARNRHESINESEKRKIR